MSVEINVSVKSEVVPPGSEVPVDIEVVFAQPTRVRGIHANFRGFERTEADYTETERDSDGKTKTVTKTAVEFVDVIRQDFVLAGQERLGCVGGLVDAIKTLWGGGIAKTFKGIEKYSLLLNIPETAPGSFEGKNCRVAYELVVSIDVPAGWDKSVTKRITVVPMVDTKKSEATFVRSEDQAENRSLWERMFGKEIDMQMAIDRDCVSPGDSVGCLVVIDPAEPFKVKRMTLGLLGLETSEARGHTETSRIWLPLEELEVPRGSIDFKWSHEFQFTVPDQPHPRFLSRHKLYSPMECGPRSGNTLGGRFGA